MKKWIVIGILLLAMSLVVAGCQKMSHNGDLDGQWQLMTVTDNAAGTETVAERIYYCFMLHTANLYSPYGDVACNMTYEEGKTIVLEFPYNTPWELVHFGLSYADFPDYGRDETGVVIAFVVNEISSSRMILTTPSGTILAFRKF